MSWTKTGGRGLWLVSVLAAGWMVCGTAEGAGGPLQRMTVSGKIVDEQARPLAGARVRIYEMTGQGGSASGDQVQVRQESTTGPDGAFTFAVPDTGNYRSIMVVAGREGLALGWDLWDGREDRKRDIVLTAPQEISGTVVDAQGAPLADANVFVAVGQIGGREDSRWLLGPLSRRLLAARTDAAGRFSLGDLPAGATFELGAERSGYGTMTTFDLAQPARDPQFAAGQADVKLVMQREARIEGRVVQADGGQPLGAIPVMLKGDRTVGFFLPEPVLSGTDGAFAFDGLVPDRYMVSVPAPQDGMAEWVGPPVQVVLEAGQASTDVVVEVGKGAMVEFTVTDRAGGQPIENARVGTRRVQDGQWFHATTNEQGIARMRLSPGGYHLTEARKEGYSGDQEGKSLSVVEGQDQHMDLTLAARPRFGLAGVIRDPDGRPLAGAVVSVLPGSRDQTVTDDEGKYELNWDPASWGRDAVFCLLVRHVDRNLAAAVEMTADTQSLDAVLAPATALYGKVVASDGHALADVHIGPYLRMSNWGSPVTGGAVETGPDGTFEITCVPRDRRYGIYVSADGYGTLSHDIGVEFTQADRGDVGTLTLPVANLSLSGQVVDLDSNPLPGARLSSSGSEGQPDIGGMTDTEGRFTLSGLCAGEVYLDAHGVAGGKIASARALAFAGATGVRIVLREGQSPLQYHSGKTYEQILADSERVIAGVAVDESGLPVPGVSVGVCSLRQVLEDGRSRRMYSSFPALSATTDEKGRFAIALEEDCDYSLLVSPEQHAPDIVYDVPADTKDLKVTLAAGGTIEGVLLRSDGTQKAPIPNAEVRLEETSRSAFTSLGFDRDRTTLTDAEGRFRFEHIQTRIRPQDTAWQTEWTPVSRVWQLSHSDTSETFAFGDESRIEGFELLVKPDIDSATPLTGNPLPPFEGIALDLDGDQTAGKAVLICFFDYQQRPSRNTVMQLAQQAQSLEQQGLVVALVQASSAEPAALDTWATDNSLPFTVGRITADVEATRAAWGVKALSWLILTDRQHRVQAEGFALDALEARIAEQATEAADEQP